MDSIIITRRARNGSVILTDRLCKKQVAKRVKFYDRKCPGLYVSIIPAGAATFFFKFTDRTTGTQRSKWLAVHNPETFTVEQARTGVYWFERGSPDPVWLTVLVLDAIELARGGSQLTFRKTSSAGAPLVFVAYQHADSKWLDELKKHLGALIHSERIEFFNDREIGGGEEWDPAIRKKLNSAKVIVPMISPNFLSSKYIQTVELPTAIRRHVLGQVKVLPILLDSCDWEALESGGFSLSRINFLPKDGRNDLKPLAQWGARKNDAFTQIARTIRNLTRPAG